jgi:hypothetical protein
MSQKFRLVQVPAEDVCAGDRLPVTDVAVAGVRRTASREVMIITEHGGRIPMPNRQLVWVRRSIASKG